jgi:hypothetical protein
LSKGLPKTTEDLKQISYLSGPPENKSGMLTTQAQQWLFSDYQGKTE